MWFRPEGRIDARSGPLDSVSWYHRPMPQTRPFEFLNQLLNRDEIAIDAAELHGSLCAQIAVTEAPEAARWLRLALGREIEPERLPVDLKRALDWLFDWTLAGLNDPQLGFRLLLPDDDQPLPARSAALARWCGGFVSGFGAAVAGSDREMSAEAREFLTDLSAIAQAEVDANGGEEDEVAFVELSEYARIGAMLVYDDGRPDRGR